MLILCLRKFLHIFFIITGLWLARAVLMMLLIVTTAARIYFVPVTLRRPETVRVWWSVTIFPLVIMTTWIINSYTCLSSTSSLTSINRLLFKVADCRNYTIILLIFYVALIMYGWVLFLTESLSICLSWSELIDLKF